MDARPPPLTAVLMLGASLIGLGALLWLWSQDDPVPDQDILVHQRILAPDMKLLFNGTVVLAPGNGTVLGALLRAAETGGFEVNVTHAYYGRAFVQSIADYRNQGACGWVYDHNEVRGPRSADEQVLADQDRVFWHWDCAG